MCWIVLLTAHVFSDLIIITVHYILWHFILQYLYFAHTLPASGDILALVLAKQGAVQEWRDIIGPTNPNEVNSPALHMYICAFKSILSSRLEKAAIANFMSLSVQKLPLVTDSTIYERCCITFGSE